MKAGRWSPAGALAWVLLVGVVTVAVRQERAAWTVNAAVVPPEDLVEDTMAAMAAMAASGNAETGDGTPSHSLPEGHVMRPHVTADVRRVNLADTTLEAIVAAREPVVISNAASGAWPALERWTPEYLHSVTGTFVNALNSTKSNFVLAGAKPMEIHVQVIFFFKLREKEIRIAPFFSSFLF